MVQKSIHVHHHETPLQVNKELKSPFQNIIYWALFLSILGFILIATFMAGALLGIYNMGMVRSEVHGLLPLLVGTAYLLVSVLLFFPVFRLFQYSIQANKTA